MNIAQFRNPPIKEPRPEGSTCYFISTEKYAHLEYVKQADVRNCMVCHSCMARCIKSVSSKKIGNGISLPSQGKMPINPVFYVLKVDYRVLYCLGWRFSSHLFSSMWSSCTVSYHSQLRMVADRKSQHRIYYGAPVPNTFCCIKYALTPKGFRPKPCFCPHLHLPEASLVLSRHSGRGF